MIALLKRKWRSWLRLPTRVRLLFLPTWCLLGLARLAVLTLPFRWLARWLGEETGVTPFTPVLSAIQVEVAGDIGRCIGLAAAYTPWQSLCQPQAFAARWWLGVYGIPCVVHYGVCRDPVKGLAAHAWVCAGPVAVTGGQSWDEFVVVRSFSKMQKQ